PASMHMPCPIAVSNTPSESKMAEPAHKFSMSKALLAVRLISPAAPHQCVCMRPATIWTAAERNRIDAMAVPLTTGPCQGTSLSRNKGAMDAYRPKTPNAKNGRQHVSTKALEAAGSGQVSLGTTSRKDKRPAALGLASS